MQSQIRLAEMQGLLRGKHISAIQFKSLIIIRYLNNIEQSRKSVEALKHAFLAAQIGSPEEIFPEMYEKEKKDVDEVPYEEEPEEGADYDYSGVTWKSGSDSLAEYERLMAQVNAAKDGMMTGDMLADEATAWTDWS